jgi:hypothetical protein
MMNWFNKDPATQQKEDLEKEKHEDEQAVHDERRICKIYEMCRDFYATEKLIGHICVESSWFAFGCSIEGDVGLDKIHEVANSRSGDVNEIKGGDINTEKADEELGQTRNILAGWVKRSIDSMRRRALAYKGKPYQEGLTLSTSFNVSAPPLAAFSTKLSATVDSLIASQELKPLIEAEKQVTREERLPAVKEEKHKTEADRMAEEFQHHHLNPEGKPLHPADPRPNDKLEGVKPETEFGQNVHPNITSK